VRDFVVFPALRSTHRDEEVRHKETHCTGAERNGLKQTGRVLLKKKNSPTRDVRAGRAWQER
jgi:hypothetical protein